MEMERKILVALCLIGIAAGVAAAMALMRKRRKNVSGHEDNSFGDLIRTQAVCEEVDGAVLAEWFSEQAGKSDEKLLFFLARPTENTAKMFAISGLPRELDRKHSLFQAAVDEKKHVPVAVRLISFGRLNSSIEEMLEDREYVIIKK